MFVSLDYHGPAPKFSDNLFSVEKRHFPKKCDYAILNYTFKDLISEVVTYRERLKESSEIEMKIAKEKQVTKPVGEITYPYMIKDPSGKEHKIMGDNHTITIGWGTQGLITYDRKDKIWRYDNNHKPFDKAKKITPRHRLHSNLSFEYDDLND